MPSLKNGEQMKIELLKLESRNTFGVHEGISFFIGLFDSKHEYFRDDNSCT